MKWVSWPLSCGTNIAMTSQWARWRLKNPASPLFTIVYSGTDQRKHQSSASLAFVRGIHRRPVNSPPKWLVTRKKFPFNDVIMTESAQATVLYYEFEKYTVEITATYPMVQWINGNIVFELTSRGYYIFMPNKLYLWTASVHWHRCESYQIVSIKITSMWSESTEILCRKRFG